MGNDVLDGLNDKRLVDDSIVHLSHQRFNTELDWWLWMGSDWRVRGSLLPSS